MPKGRVSKEQYEEQLAETEQAIVRLRSAYRVEQFVARKFKVHPRTVRSWMQVVRARWRANATEVDKEGHRNDIEAILNDVIFQAANKSYVVKNDDGTVVVDINPNSPTYGKPIVKANPDLQRVLHATIQLRALYGVDATPSLKVNVSKDLDTMPDLSKLSPEQQKATEQWLTSIAPGGDIAKLAGEFFDFGTTPVAPTPKEPDDGDSK